MLLHVEVDHDVHADVKLREGDHHFRSWSHLFVLHLETSQRSTEDEESLFLDKS